MKKIWFLASHPIQYQIPMLEYLSKNSRKFKLIGFFCSDIGHKPYYDKQFKKIIRYDNIRMNNINHIFLRNYALRESVSNSFFGLINPGFFLKLKKERPDLLIVHGWSYFTHFFSIMFAHFLGIKVAIRSETPLKQELKSNKLKKILKNLILKKMLFRMIDYFLYIGSANKKFYEYFEVNKKKLIFFPYYVDNDFFTESFEKSKRLRLKIRESLGFAEGDKVLLFVGKLFSKKRPLDLIEVFKRFKDTENFKLILVGDGEQKSNIVSEIRKHNLGKMVQLAGFVNQSALGRYYTAADLFILPSGQGETWGLVINEAMNFELSIAVSNTVGCKDDLVFEESNGFSFDEGNLDELEKK